MRSDDHVPGAVCTALPPFTSSLPFLHTQVAVVESAGGRLLVGTPYSSLGRSALFAVPLAGGETLQIPLDDQGAGAVIPLADSVLLGTRTGRILLVDLTDNSVTELAHPLPGESLCAGMASPTGLVYFGSTPGGRVVEFDPHARAVTRIFTPPTAGPWRAGAFALLPDGRITAFLSGPAPCALSLTPGSGEFTWQPLSIEETRIAQAVVLEDGQVLLVTGHGEHLICLDADTLQPTHAWPALPDGDCVYHLELVEGTLLASASPTGGMYRWTAEGWQWLGTPLPGDPLLFTSQADGRLYGFTYQGRVVQSTPDWRMYTLTPLPTRTEDGQAITAMGIGPDRVLYFALQGNMRLGSWDPEEDKITERFVAAPLPGEVSALGFAGERLLMGCAPSGVVMAYYADLPYRLQENPREVARLDGANRPLGPMVHHQRFVYFATEEEAGGAIVRLDPMENTLRAFPDILPGQRLTSLIADRLHDVLLAGADGGQLAVWSPFEERTLRVITPFTHAATVRVWAAEGGRAYVTDDNTRLAIINSSSGEVLQAGDFPLGAITALITTQHGELYGLAGGWFFRYHPEENRLERLVQAEGTLLTEVRPSLFAFTREGRVFTVQVW